MDDITRLMCLSVSMLVGCYVAGSIPLAVTLSEDRLRIVTVLGAGLLVGTALAVIIPEGVHALYEQQHIHAMPHFHEHTHSHEDHDHGTNAEVPSPVLTTAALPDVGSSLELHSLIGISLCLGFVFMLLVDQLSGGHSHSHSPSSDVENGGRRSGKITATIGLVVHAAADGIALGAAVSTSRTDVEMIIFIAIMLHKAPAAFGLSTFLLHEGLGRNSIRRHLLVFASAAPLLALITYFGLSQSHKEALSTVNGTGIAMLFSAGTFLYVATVHVLPEIGKISNGSSTDCAESSDSHKLRRIDLIIMVVGIVSPLLLSTMHHH